MEFKVGDIVILLPDPKGLIPFPSHYGKVGIITEIEARKSASPKLCIGATLKGHTATYYFTLNEVRLASNFTDLEKIIYEVD